MCHRLHLSGAGRVHAGPDESEIRGGQIPAKSNLLRAAGLEYVPSTDEDVCCGFGGSYSVDFPEISAEILKQKLDSVKKCGADVLVTDCPGCVLQIEGEHAQTRQSYPGEAHGRSRS